MKALLRIANLSSLLIALFVSYFVNTKGGRTPSIAEISFQYDNLLTPAGYAFAIWGLIYPALFAFAVFLFFKPGYYVREIGWWFVLANLANAAWVIVFTHNMPGLSVLLMVVIFLALLKIVLNTNMERWDAPFPVIGFIWWPVSLYFGWINVALIANIAAWLTSAGWDGAPLNPVIWAVLILMVAAIVFITMIWKRNMREYAFTGVWGITAIAVKNWENNPQVAGMAIVVAIIIFVNAAAHGYKNRATAPFLKRSKPRQI